LTDIVLDASAGVELALRTAVGRRLRRRLPTGATTWVPEHYYAEAVAVLRRDEISGRLPAGRVQVALDRLLGVPAHRFAVKGDVHRRHLAPTLGGESPASTLNVPAAGSVAVSATKNGT
jgi:predicted nucleic acid-binding protein